MTANAAIKHQVWIAAPIDRVFELVGTGRGWNQWYTSSCTLEPRPGGRFEPEWRDFGPDRYSHRDEGRVLNLDMPRHIAFEWTPLEGVRTRFTIDLRPEGEGTTVRLADHGYPVETHSQIIAFANAAAGWGEALTLLKFCAETGLHYQQPGQARPVPVLDEPPAPSKKRRTKDAPA
jgi:uncharacterized protein YndB with AHSA1/START domain